MTSAYCEAQRLTWLAMSMAPSTRACRCVELPGASSRKRRRHRLLTCWSCRCHYLRAAYSGSVMASSHMGSGHARVISLNTGTSQCFACYCRPQSVLTPAACTCSSAGPSPDHDHDDSQVPPHRQHLLGEQGKKVRTIVVSCVEFAHTNPVVVSLRQAGHSSSMTGAVHNKLGCVPP